MGFVFISIQPLYVFGLQHLVHLHLLIDITYCHFVHCFGVVFVVLFVPSTFVLFPCDLMTVFSVVFGFLSLLCVYLL